MMPPEVKKEKVMQAAPTNKAHLKRVITRSWREVDQDKQMIRSLISSIPKRLQAVIDVDNRQITKEDYYSSVTLCIETLKGN